MAPKPSRSGSVWGSVPWLYASAHFLAYFWICVWHCRTGKNWFPDINHSRFFFFFIDSPCWRIPTRTPNKAHLAMGSNDNFLQDSVCIKEKRPSPSILPLWLPASLLNPGVCCNVYFPSKKETLGIAFLSVLSLETYPPVWKVLVFSNLILLWRSQGNLCRAIV